MDKFTFGDSKAAVNLVEILDKPEHSLCSPKALRMLSKYMTSINALEAIPHKGTRETVLRLWHDRFINQVNESSFPIVVSTHLNCVATSQYRKQLRYTKGE